MNLKLAQKLLRRRIFNNVQRFGRMPDQEQSGAAWKNMTDGSDGYKIKFRDGSILICDGELGLTEAAEKRPVIVFFGPKNY